MNAIEIFLILCLGHLASDFLLQTDAMVKAKKHGGTAYWKHGLIHYVAILVVTVLADPALLARIRFQAICVALVGAHLLIDFCKERLTAAAKIRDNALTFLADQVAHIVTIVAAAVAQAILPVPHVASCDAMRNEEAKERVVWSCWCGAIGAAFLRGHRQDCLCY